MKKILIAGATGNLGGLIAQNLLTKKNAQVFAIVRDKANAKAQKLGALGIALLEADLQSEAQLTQATKGMDIVVSALSGGPDAIVQGQINLLNASLQNGVHRFVPSDYSSDYFKLNYGDNVNMDMRKQVFEAIKKSGIGYTIFLNGAFMEIFASAFFNVIDFEKSTVNFWGAGTELFDLTTMPDTAKYIADAILDEQTLNKVIHIAGDELSMNDVVAKLSANAGMPFEIINNGTNEELSQLIQNVKNTDPANVFAYVFLQYKHAMFSGIGKLSHPIRTHYDGKKLAAFSDFIADKRNQYQYQASF